MITSRPDPSIAVRALKSAAPYIRMYKNKVFIIKAGGAVFSDEVSTRALIEQVAILHQVGIKTVLVHGGGPQLDSLQATLGIDTRMVHGRRVTDQKSIDVTAMVLNGLINTRILAICRELDIEAIGLSGVDAGLIRAHKRPPVQASAASSETVDYGFVGNIGNMTIAWQELYRKHINLLPSDDQARCQKAGGDPNIHYYQSYWKLADDEALYVHIKDIPDCQTWNLQLSNYWMQSLDYRYFKVCVNKFTAHYEPDGSVKIVIAAHDPGPKFPNWLNTLGHGEGGMLGRYVGAKVFPKEMPAKVVKLGELAGTTA